MHPVVGQLEVGRRGFGAGEHSEPLRQRQRCSALLPAALSSSPALETHLRPGARLQCPASHLLCLQRSDILASGISEPLNLLPASRQG